MTASTQRVTAPLADAQWTTEAMQKADAGWNRPTQENPTRGLPPADSRPDVPLGIPQGS